jgi:hypothetical protein
MASAARTLSYCTRLTARRLCLPFAVAMAACWFCLRLTPPLGDGAGAADASGLWLHLPCATLSFAAVAAALGAWPLLSRAHARAALLVRVRPAGVDGCAPAALGALVALAAALLLAGLGFAAMQSARGLGGDAHARVALVCADARPILDRAQRQLTWRAPAEPLAEVRIRVLAFAADPGRGGEAALRVTAAGSALHDAPLVVRGNTEDLVLPLSARVLPSLEIAVEGGSDLVLLFPADAVRGVVADARSGAVNAMLAASAYLLPAALALALAALLRRFLSAPVHMAGAGLCLLLFLITDWLPGSTAIAAFASHRWIGTGNFLGSETLSLCMVALVMAAAAFTGGRPTP